MVRCCAGFAAVPRETSRNDRSGDLFGKLNADVRVTRQPRRRSAAEALRILSVTGVEDFARNATYLSSTKPRAVLAGWWIDPECFPGAMLDNCGSAA